MGFSNYADSTKNASHTFERGAFVKSKKINIDKLPKIDNTISEIEALEGKNTLVEKTT